MPPHVSLDSSALRAQKEMMSQQSFQLSHLESAVDHLIHQVRALADAQQRMSDASRANNATSQSTAPLPTASSRSEPRRKRNRKPRKKGDEDCCEEIVQTLDQMKQEYEMKTEKGVVGWPDQDIGHHAFGKIIPIGFSFDPRESVRRQLMSSWQRNLTFEVQREMFHPALYAENSSHIGQCGMTYDLNQPSHFAVIATSRKVQTLDATSQHSFLIYRIAGMLSESFLTERTSTRIQTFVNHCALLAVKTALIERIRTEPQEKVRDTLRDVLTLLHREESGQPMVALDAAAVPFAVPSGYYV